jgi:hypothetical protein
MPASSRHVREVGARAVLLALALLLFAPTPVARAVELKPVSSAQFRADVARLQSLVATCGQAAAACDPSQVGADEQVGGPQHKESAASAGSTAPGSFAMHWQWLRDALEQARKTKGDRASALNEATARLNEIAQESQPAAGTSAGQSFSRARVAANSVLKRAEFQAVGEPTWWDRQKARLWQWLARFFDGVGRLGSAAPWLGRLLEWLLFTGAAVGLLFFLLRNVARQRLRVAMGAGAVQATAWDRESTDWAHRAEEHASAGQWRDAVHSLYWAAIVLLESRRAWRHNPARTPREYVRLLRAGSGQQKALRGLTQIFERVWYGLREADAEEYAHARALYEQLATGAETASSDTLGASVASAAGTA